MKKILLFAFLFCSLSALAQYPAQPTTKQELGRQTTGDGLIYRGSGAPAYTPSNNRNAWIYYDTTNNRLYKSRLGSWSLMVQDTSAFNEIQMPYIVDDTLYLTQNVTGEPLTRYVNRVWPITNLSDTTSITGENQGDVAIVASGDTVAFRGSAYWSPFSGGGGGGSFNDFILAGDSGSSTITDGETATIAGGHGINTTESGGTVTVTADTSQLVTPSDIAALMTNWLIGGTSGTPQTVANGQTATIAAGTGMTTTAAATRTVTIALANTAIAAGVYGSATQVSQITFDAQGRGILAANVSILLPISAVTALPDSLAAKITRITSTNNYIPRWVGTSMGNSFLSQDAVSVMMDANKQFELTGGTTANRPPGVASAMYYNTSNNWFDFHNGTSWFNPARSAYSTGLYTSTRVPFADGSGLLTDASGLVYNTSISALGVGIASPGSGTPFTGLIETGRVITANSQGLLGRLSGGVVTTLARIGSTDDFELYVTNSKKFQFFMNSVAFCNLSPTGLGINLGSVASTRMLEARVSDAVTNAMVFPLRLTHITSGTAAAGSGAGLEFEAESAGGTNRVAGTIENPYTTATNAAEVSDLVFRTMRAGTLTESLRSLGNGTLQIGTLSGTASKIGAFTSGNIATVVTPTITAGGTTGDRTINELAGTVNIAAAGTTVTVTNSLVTANSLVFCTLRTNDTTATVKNVVPTAGSFTINLGAAATGEISIGFFVVN